MQHAEASEVAQLTQSFSKSVLMGLGSRLHLLLQRRATASFWQPRQISGELEIPGQWSPVLRDVKPTGARGLRVASHEGCGDK